MDFFTIALSHQLLQKRPLCCKQLRDPSRYGELKSPRGNFLLQMAVALEAEYFVVSLLEAGVSVTAVNSEGQTAWEVFVCLWVKTYHGAKFYMMLKAFIARLGASADVTFESGCESTLHRYGEHLVAMKVITHSALHPGFVQVRMPGAVDDSIRCLFLLLDAGCRVNARDKFQDLPFQTSVFGEPNSVAAIPLLAEMWKMLADAGSRLHLSFSETQKLEIILKDFRGENTEDLLSLHAQGLLTAHSGEAQERLRQCIKTSSVCKDVINKLCQPLTLKNLCLNCVRMNCYPNAFVAASKLPLPRSQQEKVRPCYQTYNEQFGSLSLAQSL